MRRTIVIVLLVLGVPILLIGGSAFFILDWNAKPLCHKQLLMGLENWLDGQQSTVAPNINGRSADSFSAFQHELGNEPRWETMYHYVPGLQKGDPGDLVIAYMAVPTRYLHHATLATIFDEKRWIIIPLDFAGSSSFTAGQGQRTMGLTGECSENVSLADFRQRLQKTLEYLRENNRPNWQAVVAEHEAFLQSIPAEN